ncbi:MAG: hypothetical protein ACFFE8_06420 [Candidatus Heimdallarchaeota archaeon]
MIITQFRYPALFLAVLSAATGILIGVLRLGYPSIPLPPYLTVSIFVAHPEIIILGFFNLVIYLERWEARGAIEHPGRWTSEFLIVPPCLSAVCFLLNLLSLWLNGQNSIFWHLGWFWTLIGLFFMIWGQSWVFRTIPQSRGSSSFLILASFLLGGMALFIILDWTLNRFYLYLVLYLVLIVLGERLDLGNVPNIVFRVVVGGGIVLPFLALGDLIFASPLVLQAVLGIMTLILVFLVVFDTGLTSIQSSTWIRDYQQWILRGAYSWLGFGLLLLGAYSVSFPLVGIYDSALHSITIGFILSMVIGHAPLIFPGLLGKAPIQKLRGGLIWPLLLWGTLALRIIGNSGISSIPEVRILAETSGWLAMLVLLGFALSMVEAVKKYSYFPWERP